MSINGAPRGAGMPVPEQTQFCVSCRERGHACAAQRGINLCVFCEDGERCPVTAAEIRKGVQQTAEKATAVEATNKTKPDADGFSEWQKTRAAYREKRKAARADKEGNVMTANKCKASGCQALTKTDHGYCPKHFWYSKVKHPELLGRKCSTGCGGNIRSDNKSGICKSCAKAGVKKPVNGAPSSAAKPKQQSKAARPNGHAVAAQQSEAVATISVTEGALNQWWGKQSIQSKADIFSLAMAEDEELSSK